MARAILGIRPWKCHWHPPHDWRASTRLVRCLSMGACACLVWGCSISISTQQAPVPAPTPWRLADPADSAALQEMQARQADDVAHGGAQKYYFDQQIALLVLQGQMDDLEQRKDYAANRGDGHTEQWLWEQLQITKQKMQAISCGAIDFMTMQELLASARRTTHGAPVQTDSLAQANSVPRADSLARELELLKQSYQRSLITAQQYEELRKAAVDRYVHVGPATIP